MVPSLHNTLHHCSIIDTTCACAGSVRHRGLHFRGGRSRERFRTLRDCPPARSGLITQDLPRWVSPASSAKQSAVWTQHAFVPPPSSTNPSPSLATRSPTRQHGATQQNNIVKYAAADATMMGIRQVRSDHGHYGEARWRTNLHTIGLACHGSAESWPNIGRSRPVSANARGTGSAPPSSAGIVGSRNGRNHCATSSDMGADAAALDVRCGSMKVAFVSSTRSAPVLLLRPTDDDVQRRTYF